MNESTEIDQIENEVEVFSNYPALMERIQALVIDWVVLLILIVGFSNLFNQIGDVSENMRMMAFIFVFCLYEPIFVSFFGGSVGHLSSGLRVKRSGDTSKKVFILVAVFRYIIKLGLGFVSFLTVSSDQKRRAIHDKLTGTIVVYSESKKAK